jgi:hypothetical protein
VHQKTNHSRQIVYPPFLISFPRLNSRILHIIDCNGSALPFLSEPNGFNRISLLCQSFGIAQDAIVGVTKSIGYHAHPSRNAMPYTRFILHPDTVYFVLT